MQKSMVAKQEDTGIKRAGTMEGTQEGTEGLVNAIVEENEAKSPEEVDQDGEDSDSEGKVDEESSSKE
jgi:hypothetical protein